MGLKELPFMVQEPSVTKEVSDEVAGSQITEPEQETEPGQDKADLDVFPLDSASDSIEVTSNERQEDTPDAPKEEIPSDIVTQTAQLPETPSFLEQDRGSIGETLPPEPQTPPQNTGLDTKNTSVDLPRDADDEKNGATLEREMTTLGTNDTLPNGEMDQSMSETAPVLSQDKFGNIGGLEISPQTSPMRITQKDPPAPLVSDVTETEEFVELPIHAMSLRPAIEQFAGPFVEAGDKPVLSIVLIDDQNYRLDPTVLEAIPLPVTFAVPSETPADKSLMRYYRNQGFEVVALVDYPVGAKAQEVEVVLSAALGNITDSVAVMEWTSGTVQETREISTHTGDILETTGHGLLLYEKGLNTGLQYALKIGVPAKTIYRALDNDDEDERTLRRFLDGAAFRARQEGHAIVVAHARAITLSALTFWSLQERSNSVVKVPLSQVLLLK